MKLDDSQYDYLACFRALGFESGETDWNVVRTAYRRLIRSWHPDRTSASDLHLSEERAKQINAAYERLAEYYWAHGHLPQISVGKTNISDTISNDRATTKSFYSSHSEVKPSPGKQSASWRNSLGGPVAWGLLAVLCGYIAVHAYTPSERNSGPEPGGALSYPSPQTPTAQRTKFGMGSSLGEVLAAQGRPSRTDGDTWHYGQSTVVFHDGRVVSWDEQPTDPLHVTSFRDHTSPDLLFFGLGSSRSTVRAIQGAPDRTETDTWHYGQSAVHFDGDVVKSWDENLTSPLRVRR